MPATLLRDGCGEEESSGEEESTDLTGAVMAVDSFKPCAFSATLILVLSVSPEPSADTTVFKLCWVVARICAR
jgi:hypothetical protein